MNNNYDLILKPDISSKAMGGTELMMRRIYGGGVPRELLEAVQIHPARVSSMDKTKPQILYLHDMPEEQAVQRMSEPWWRDQFAAIVMVSNWQMDRFNMVRGLPYGKAVVMPNAIIPFDEEEVINSKNHDKDEVRFIYHTTPHRGLNILLPVFVELAKTRPNIVLDVYSSFSVYGWPERDAEFEDLFALCREHPQINYHGAQSNEVVREALLKAHIFAYPCIWTETSCLALIEAMSAGVMCVHPNYGALPETSGGLTRSYQWHEDMHVHFSRMYSYLEQILDRKLYKSDADQNFLYYFAKPIVDKRFDWNYREKEWTHLLKAIVDQSSLKDV